MILNKKYRRTSIVFILLAGLMAFAPKQDEEITVYLAGDSTLSQKETKAFPETGWGMVLHTFFNGSVRMENRAMNGRSTRTFISENRWQSIIDELKAGDYVFIQFGHNDESKEKVDRYTTPEQYKENLTRFVNETRTKNAHPVLFTPVGRRRFNDEGRAVETHPEYSPLVREVAKKLNVPLIDLDKLSMELYQEYGVEKSKLLFLHLEADEHPNYPNGLVDNTHFSELGARKIAQLAVKELKNQNIALANQIRQKL
jgi:lysophospholipase L1-like esterase